MLFFTHPAPTLPRSSIGRNTDSPSDSPSDLHPSFSPPSPSPPLHPLPPSLTPSPRLAPLSLRAEAHTQKPGQQLVRIVVVFGRRAGGGRGGCRASQTILTNVSRLSLIYPGYWTLCEGWASVCVCGGGGGMNLNRPLLQTWPVECLRGPVSSLVERRNSQAAPAPRLVLKAKSRTPYVPSSGVNAPLPPRPSGRLAKRAVVTFHQ